MMQIKPATILYLKYTRMAIILKNKTQLSIVVYSYNPSTEEEGS
jgi:hypothetical protein